MTSQSSAEQQLTYLKMIVAAGEPAGFLDCRWRRPGGPMSRRFLAAGSLDAALQLVASLASENDVYVGVALRDNDTHGGRAAVADSRLLWVESDDPRTAQRLLSFAQPPAMVVASGTPGHVQAYWRLDGPCSAGCLESANRRLALALFGDEACADASRILRPPGTLNHKHDPPRPVELLLYRPRKAVALTDVLKDLPEDPRALRPVPAVTGSRVLRTSIDRELLAVPATEYVRVLARRSANREGKVRCPFHDDRDPSLQLYPDNGFFCFGSGCRRGGTIFDFAGYLWGITPRGAGFLELRSRLAERFTVGNPDAVS